MNTFRTVIPYLEFPFNISHMSQILCIGSCFTEHIGGLYVKHKFPTLINPTGIIYNPISIGESLAKLANGDQISSDELIRNNNRYYHWDFHGDFSHETKEALVKTINQAMNKAHQFLVRTNVLFITFGTAYAFKRKSSNTVVANCHKFPNDQFERVLLSNDEILTSLQTTITKLLSENPDLQIVFTISPIRHLRDGLVENQLSKAQLITAVHQLVSTFDCAHYFPAYELVMDDLRDYRFYDKDMIHLNQVAIDYIWEYVQQSFFDSKTNDLNKSISAISRDLSHKAFYPDSAQYQSFLESIIQKIEDLKVEHPYLEYSLELNELRRQLKD